MGASRHLWTIRLWRQPLELPQARALAGVVEAAHNLSTKEPSEESKGETHEKLSGNAADGTPEATAEVPDPAWGDEPAPQHGTIATRTFTKAGLGFLVSTIGRLAVTCRFFGGRLRAALWKQRTGLSLCEAAIRVRCCQIEGSQHAAQAVVSLSLGRLLVDLCYPTAGLEIEAGVLKGWGAADRSVTRLVVPHGLAAGRSEVWPSM